MIASFNKFIDTILNWKNISGYNNRKLINNSKDRSIAVVEYLIDVNKKFNLSDKKIVFFSDIHFGSISLDHVKIKEKIDQIKPDWIIFGGDLIIYASYQNQAFEFLQKITSNFPNVPKLAVYGNWDRRRKKWYSHSRLQRAYEGIGFKLLINEAIECDGVSFYGIDEPRSGNPTIDKNLFSKKSLNCLISHSVDPVIDNSKIFDQNKYTLALCGHSHGGQIRIPFFGALFTSTKYWKLFEYGHYYLKKNKLDLIVTSGIGTTRLPIRLFCDSELVVIKFSDA